MPTTKFKAIDSPLDAVGELAPPPILFQSLNLLTGLTKYQRFVRLKCADNIVLLEGQILFKKGAVADGCYWLKRGVLKVSVTSDSGRKRVLAIRGPGSIVGELGLIDESKRSVTVEALRDCELTFVSRATFSKCLHEHPEVYRYLVSMLASRLRQANEDLEAANFLTMKARVARALLRLAEHLGQQDVSGKISIEHKLHQEDLAAMAGVARENVSRTLNDWRRRNIIAKKSAYNYMVDKAKLQHEVIARD